MVQAGYEAQWGANGRDDLGTISLLGGNAVRLHSSIGLDYQHKHDGFLDRAEEVGIHVIPGYHTQMLCDEFDCFNSWKDATKQAWQKGYMKDKKWHPAISMIVVQEEPDVMNFGGSEDPPTCSSKPENKCWIKAMLSAIDGVLMAEKEQGITAANGANLPNLTVAWSMGSRDSIDGKFTEAIGYFGFQDTVLGISDPVKIAGYHPKIGVDALKHAFETRWTHSMNVYSSWEFIKGKVGPIYKSFEPTPWAIMRFDLNTKEPSDVSADLTSIDQEAQSPGSYFVGATTYTFQKKYEEAAATDGIFKLGAGTAPMTKTGAVCEEDPRTKASVCKAWPVHCLQDSLASAVAGAWGGAVKGRGMWCGTAESEQVVV